MMVSHVTNHAAGSPVCQPNAVRLYGLGVLTLPRVTPQQCANVTDHLSGIGVVSAFNPVVTEKTGSFPHLAICVDVFDLDRAVSVSRVFKQIGPNGSLRFVQAAIHVADYDSDALHRSAGEAFRRSVGRGLCGFGCFARACGATLLRALPIAPNTPRARPPQKAMLKREWSDTPR